MLHSGANTSTRDTAIRRRSITADVDMDCWRCGKRRWTLTSSSRPSVQLLLIHSWQRLTRHLDKQVAKVTDERQHCRGRLPIKLPFPRGILPGPPPHKIAPFHEGSRPLYNTWFLGPPQSTPHHVLAKDRVIQKIKRWMFFGNTMYNSHKLVACVSSNPWQNYLGMTKLKVMHTQQNSASWSSYVLQTNTCLSWALLGTANRVLQKFTAILILSRILNRYWHLSQK